MTNYRESLRLHSLGLNKTEIAASCHCARNTVAATLQRAAVISQNHLGTCNGVHGIVLDYAHNNLCPLFCSFWGRYFAFGSPSDSPYFKRFILKGYKKLAVSCLSLYNG